MALSIWDIPDTDENILRTAEIEFAGLPDMLADFRHTLIQTAILNWPQLKEPYIGGFFALETDGIPMQQLVADAIDVAMEVIEESLSTQTRHALRVMRDQ